MNVIYILDIILVSLWALFALCNPVSGSVLVFPVILIRLVSVFSLRQREREGWLPIVIFLLIALSSMSLRSYDFNDFVLRPFARIYDYIVMLVTGHSTLLEGAYHFLGNHGDLVPAPHVSWDIFVACYIAWLALFPIATYSYFLLKRRLRKSHWCWKKIIVASILYVVLSGIIIALHEFDPAILPGAGRAWWLIVLLIPLLTNIRWQSLSSFCHRYIILTFIFVIAIMPGIYIQSMGSLIAIVIVVPLFYYFIGYKWQKIRPMGLYRNLYMLLLAGISFWMAQYAMDATRIVLLVISVVLTGFVTFHMWRNTRNVTASSIIFVVCAFILPSIAIGYNQFNCIGSKRMYNFADYDYSYRGLLKVKSLDGVAIRDRFGYITPTENEQIESIGNSTKPFVKFKHDGFWGVYDLERQSVVVEPKYNDILPYDKNSWRLMDEYCVRYGCHDFFVSPGYYYRYRKCGITSDCPFIHGLEDELPLKYDCEVKGAKYIDSILTEMMTKLWEKPDSVSHADFYYNWTCEVNEMIANIQSKVEVFDDDSDITREAMQKLEEYIDPGCGGSQAEMNATSYVLSTIENFRMMQSVQDLEYRLSPIDMRREYTLFNEFMSAYEDWEIKRDEYKGQYSDRPRERNAELCARFKDRKKSIDDFRAVVKGDTIIPFTPSYPQSAVDRYFNQLASVGSPETRKLVEPIRIAFKNWIEYRNQIATQMPNQIAASYRNQTRQLKKFYTSDKFLHEDEF